MRLQRGKLNGMWHMYVFTFEKDRGQLVGHCTFMCVVGYISDAGGAQRTEVRLQQVLVMASRELP